MSPQSRAAIFITTLTELWNEDRELRMARLRLQHRAQAERFMHTVWAEIDGSMSPSELALPTEPAGHEAVSTLSAEETGTFSHSIPPQPSGVSP